MNLQEREYLEAHVWDVILLATVVFILTMCAFSYVPPHH
jgi:hypothetical protein